MVSTLFAILIIVAVAYAAFWLIGQAFPEPIALIARIIVGILALAAILPHLGVAVPW